MEKSLTVKVYREGNGWCGVVYEDNEEYADVFTLTAGYAFAQAIHYAMPIIDEIEQPVAAGN